MLIIDILGLLSKTYQHNVEYEEDDMSIWLIIILLLMYLILIQFIPG